MAHLRFVRIMSARMKINSRNLLFVTLITITALEVGCNKSQQAQAPSGLQTFASPEAAGQAIYTAAKAGDSNVVLAIFGPEAKELILPAIRFRTKPRSICSRAAMMRCTAGASW